MNIGDIITVGKRRKVSVWTGGLKGHKKAKILWIDKMEDTEENVYGIALPEDMQKAEFDPELDYHILYEDEINHAR
jgi:hypothetical protein